MSKIFYIMGKSSSGKDTIFKEIRKLLPQLKIIVLYTTRPKREGEEEGREYHFTDEKHLEELKKQGKVIECRTYETIHGPWSYFTVDDGQIDLEKDSYLVIGTLESYEKMRNYFDKDKVIPIYVEVEDGERLKRALDREREQTQPKYAELCRRFLADTEDFKEENLTRLGITTRFPNHDLPQTLQQITLYITKRV